MSISSGFVHVHKTSLFAGFLSIYLPMRAYIWCYHICQTKHYQILCLQQPEAVPSTSDCSGPSALPTEQPGSFRPQAPNLAGAVEFNDVKTLLKEWITTISGKGWHASNDLASQGKLFCSRLCVFFLLHSLLLSLVASHSSLATLLLCSVVVT